MPVVKGNLQRNGTKKIRKNYTYLLDELDGRVLVDYLYQEEVFDLNDKEEICRQFPERTRTDLLLTKLLRSGPYQAYDVFLESLRKHYPHVVERLEETAIEGNVEELKEHSTPTKEEMEERIEIIQTLQEWHDEDLNILFLAPHRRDSLISPSSFNLKHLPDGFCYKEVVDCVHSLAKQTVLVVEVKDQSETVPGRSFEPLCSGRVWRVQRSFSRVDNKTCPCKDCEGSTIPRKRWGEYIILTGNIVRCDTLRFVLGYNSDESISDISVLTGVSVSRRDESLDFTEVLCITHDADTSEGVENICHWNTFYREKLLNTCHLLRKDKKLAVHVSHPVFGPKQISLGEWVEDEGERTSGLSRHVYTADASLFGSDGGPVLLVDSGNAFVTLHYRRGLKGTIRESCGYAWSL